MGVPVTSVLGTFDFVSTRAAWDHEPGTGDLKILINGAIATIPSAGSRNRSTARDTSEKEFGTAERITSSSRASDRLPRPTSRLVCGDGPANEGAMN